MHGTRKKRRGGKTIPSEPVIPQPQASTNPGADFYKYVNGNWLRHVNMPPYLSSYGVSEEIEDSINKELMNIIIRKMFLSIFLAVLLINFRIFI